MIRYILYIILFIASTNANASNGLVMKHKKDLARIENYLQNIKNLTAKFIQESPDGSIVTGTFYLKRPGKMRIEYDYPANILVVVNGAVLAYQDIELEETSYLRTNSTPASFLTRKNISFKAKDIEVTSFMKKNNLLRVSVIKKNKKEAGEFTLIFRQKPIKFLKMEVKDEMDQITQIDLKKHDFISKINKKLFIVKNNQLP